MNLIVISLEKAKERRERISSQLKSLNIDGIIMDAVDGQRLHLNKRIRGFLLSADIDMGNILLLERLDALCLILMLLKWQRKWIGNTLSL